LYCDEVIKPAARVALTFTFWVVAIKLAVVWIGK